MGRLIEKRYVVEVDGYVAAAPFARYADAVACADTFRGVPVRVTCFWSRRVLHTKRLNVARRRIVPA